VLAVPGVLREEILEPALRKQPQLPMPIAPWQWPGDADRIAQPNVSQTVGTIDTLQLLVFLPVIHRALPKLVPHADPRLGGDRR
jgi:hypothetical protein